MLIEECLYCGLHHVRVELWTTMASAGDRKKGDIAPRLLQGLVEPVALMARHDGVPLSVHDQERRCLRGHVFDGIGTPTFSTFFWISPPIKRDSGEPVKSCFRSAPGRAGIHPQEIGRAEEIHDRVPPPASRPAAGCPGGAARWRRDCRATPAPTSPSRHPNPDGSGDLGRGSDPGRAARIADVPSPSRHPSRPLPQRPQGRPHRRGAGEIVEFIGVVALVE